MMSPMRRLSSGSLAAIGAIAFALCATGVDGGPQSISREPFRILFIGNSLTAANNLPDIVESLSRARGDVMSTAAVTAGNFSLEDHWNQGNARAAIARGGWSVVVLQQGPSALPESRVLLRDYTKRFAAEAQKVGARTALYMVWPSRARARDFDGVSESYAVAARDVGGMLLPAGEAWREAWRREPSLALYADDGFHPSELGSYLAALAVWRALSAETALGLPGPRGEAADTLRLLQEAADRAVVRVSPPRGSAVPR
jgi:hypothetical protein